VAASFVPYGRVYAASAWIPPRLYLFGGWTRYLTLDQLYLGDLVYFDTNDLKWYWHDQISNRIVNHRLRDDNSGRFVSSPISFPGGRAQGSSILSICYQAAINCFAFYTAQYFQRRNGTTDCLYIYGGAGDFPQNQTLSDLWRIDLNQPTRWSLIDHGTGYFPDYTLASANPGTRVAGVAFYDLSQDRAYLFVTISFSGRFEADMSIGTFRVGGANVALADYRSDVFYYDHLSLVTIPPLPPVTPVNPPAVPPVSPPPVGCPLPKPQPERYFECGSNNRWISTGEEVVLQQGENIVINQFVATPLPTLIVPETSAIVFDLTQFGEEIVFTKLGFSKRATPAALLTVNGSVVINGTINFVLSDANLNQISGSQIIGTSTASLSLLDAQSITLSSSSSINTETQAKPGSEEQCKSATSETETTPEGNGRQQLSVLFAVRTDCNLYVAAS